MNRLEKARSIKESQKRKINLKLFAILAAMTCLLLFGLFRIIIIRSAACTYVMTDGERYETVRLYPGTVEEACSKAGFRNVEVVTRKDMRGKAHNGQQRPALCRQCLRRTQGVLQCAKAAFEFL